MRLNCCCAVAATRTISKEGSVRHTSTKFFVVWKTSLEVLRETLFRTRSGVAVKCRAGYCRANDALGVGCERLKTLSHCDRKDALSPRWGERNATAVRTFSRHDLFLR